MSKVNLCCICRHPETRSDKLLVCVKCGIMVHQFCYGVVSISMPWMCYPCQLEVTNRVCCVCSCNRKGAFTQVDSDRWAHTICLILHHNCGFYVDNQLYSLYSPGFMYYQLQSGTIHSLPIMPYPLTVSIPVVTEWVNSIRNSIQKIPSMKGYCGSIDSITGIECAFCKEVINGSYFSCCFSNCDSKFHPHCVFHNYSRFRYAVSFNNKYSIGVVCQQHQPMIQLPFLYSLPRFSDIHSLYANGISPYCIIAYIINPLQFLSPPTATNNFIPYIATAGRSIIIHSRLSPTEKCTIERYMLSIHLTPYAATKVLIDAHHYFSHYDWASPLCYATAEETQRSEGKTGVRLAPKRQPSYVLNNPIIQVSPTLIEPLPFKRSYPDDSHKSTVLNGRSSDTSTQERLVLPSKLTCTDFWKSMEHAYFETSLRFQSNDTNESPTVIVNQSPTLVSQGREIRVLIAGEVAMEIVFWFDSQSQQLLLMSYHPVGSPFSSQVFVPLSLEISNLTVLFSSLYEKNINRIHCLQSLYQYDAVNANLLSSYDHLITVHRNYASFRSLVQRMQSATQHSESWYLSLPNTDRTHMNSLLHPCFCFACYCSEGTMDADGEQEIDNPVVRCKYCSIQVHVKCSHPKEKDTPFVCDSCLFLREGGDANLLHCKYCPIRFGYLYRCKVDRENPLGPPSFVHLWCAFFHMGATITSFVTYRITAMNPVVSLQGVPVSSVSPIQQTLVQFVKRENPNNRSTELETVDQNENVIHYDPVTIAYDDSYGDQALFACSGMKCAEVTKIQQAFHCYVQPVLTEQEYSVMKLLSPSERINYQTIAPSYQPPPSPPQDPKNCPFPGGLCCICKLPLGQTRQCSQSNCQHSFHVLCLWYCGGDMTIDLTNHEYVSSGIQPQLIAYCPMHSRNTSSQTLAMIYSRNQCRSFIAANRLITQQYLPSPKTQCDLCGYSSLSPTTNLFSDIARHRYHASDFLLDTNGRGPFWQCLLCDSFVHANCMDASCMLPVFCDNDINYYICRRCLLENPYPLMQESSQYVSAVDPSLTLEWYCPLYDHGCCCICGQKQGYLGYSVDGSWAHLQCALCVNGTRFNCVPSMPRSDDSSGDSVHTGWDFKLGSDWLTGSVDSLCCHCQNQGRCIECCWPLCHKQSHPSCIDPMTEILDISDKGCIWLCDTHSSFYGIKHGNCFGLHWSRWSEHHGVSMLMSLAEHISVNATTNENSKTLSSLQDLGVDISPPSQTLPDSPRSSSPVSPVSPQPLNEDNHPGSDKMDLNPEQKNDSNPEQSTHSSSVQSKRAVKKKRSLLLICLRKPTPIRELIMSRLFAFFNESLFFTDSTNTMKSSVFRFLSRINLQSISTVNRTKIIQVCECWDAVNVYQDIWLINNMLLDLQNRSPDIATPLHNKIKVDQVWTWSRFVQTARKCDKTKYPTYWYQRRRTLRHRMNLNLDGAGSMALYILPSLVHECPATTCGICRRTEYDESFNIPPDHGFICPDCCLYHGSNLIGSFIQVYMEYQWNMFLIVGWNELEGYHILQDLEGAYITHYIGTYPYLLRTLLDIVAELSEYKEIDLHDIYQTATENHEKKVHKDMNCEQCGESLEKVKGSNRFGVRYLCESCRQQWNKSLL